jgi:hypothetical protein
MPSLAAISAIVTIDFSRILAWARLMFCVFVDGRSYLSASSTLVRLLLNISFHTYTIHCGKQFCTYLAANCRWISATFVPPTPKNAQLQVAFRGVNLLCSHLYTMLTRQRRTTTEPHTQCHRLTLSYGMTKSQQCCQSYNENIPIVFLFF